MKYFKDEIFEMVDGRDEYLEVYKEYKKSYTKTKKRLPKAFTHIYETIGFHDSIIPKVSINTDYRGFNQTSHGNQTSVEIVLIQYSRSINGWRGWVIELKNIGNLEIKAENDGKNTIGIDTFHHDELLLLKNKHILWEFSAIDACFKIEFKALTIGELDESEIKKYQNIWKDRN